MMVMITTECAAASDTKFMEMWCYNNETNFRDRPRNILVLSLSLSRSVCMLCICVSSSSVYSWLCTCLSSSNHRPHRLTMMHDFLTCSCFNNVRAVSPVTGSVPLYRTCTTDVTIAFESLHTIIWWTNGWMDGFRNCYTLFGCFHKNNTTTLLLSRGQ